MEFKKYLNKVIECFKNKKVIGVLKAIGYITLTILILFLIITPIVYASFPEKFRKEICPNATDSITAKIYAEGVKNTNSEKQPLKKFLTFSCDEFLNAMNHQISSDYVYYRPDTAAVLLYRGAKTCNQETQMVAYLKTFETYACINPLVRRKHMKFIKNLQLIQPSNESDLFDFLTNVNKVWNAIVNIILIAIVTIIACYCFPLIISCINACKSNDNN